MSALRLTGWGTVAACVALAIALPCGLLLLRRRMHGRWPRIALLAGVVTGSQLCGVLAAGAATNHAFGFWSSWSDLLATTTSAPVTEVSGHYGAPGQTAGGPAATSTAAMGPAAIPPVAAGWRTQSWSTRDQWPDRGAIVSTHVGGGSTKLSEPALVYLPPAYFHTGAQSRRLPVVLVFTGYPGTAGNLISRLHYPDRVLDGIRSGTVPNMVLVMLRPAPTFPWDTECTDVPGGPAALSFFTTDVPASVERQFALHPTRFAAMGDSTGGYCAAKVAMFAPDRFRAAVVLSGYYRPATDPTTRGIFRRRPRLVEANDLVWLLRHRPAPAISLLIAAARDEAGPDGYRTAQGWLAAVHSPMSADQLAPASGGHNFRTWSREIPFALTWLSQRITAPRPGAA